jgi:nucleoside-diphosphate-sugar epimerase
MQPMLVILGCGFIGARLARAALAAGRPVRVSGRSLAKLAPLGDLGAELVEVDAAKPYAFAKALTGTRGATVVYAVPQVQGLPAGAAVTRAAQAAREAGADCFIHLGSSALYGKRPEDDRVIDESSDVTIDDLSAFHHDEAAVIAAASAGLRTVILRLAAVYGVGRGVRNRLRLGNYQMIDDGAHWISRIHVDDLVQIILAAEARATAGAIYMVADDRPTSQLEYTTWLCERLGVPMPPSVPLFGSDGRAQVMRARNLSNAKLKRELGITLLYPSYLEGEAQIEAEEAAAG